MRNAKLTISRPSTGSGDSYIAIDISDADSGLGVIRLKVPLAEFAEAVTGMGATPCAVERLISDEMFAYLGRRKITQSVWCPRSDNYEKDVQRSIVKNEFRALHEPDGWLLWDDGCSSQQSGNEHRYTICKYVEPEA